MQYDKIDDVLKGLVKNHITVDELHKELDKVRIGMNDSSFTCKYVEEMVSDCQKRLLVDFAIDPEKRHPTKVIMTYFVLMMELGIYIGTKLKPERVFEMPAASANNVKDEPCQCPDCVKWRSEHEM